MRDTYILRKDSGHGRTERQTRAEGCLEVDDCNVKQYHIELTCHLRERECKCDFSSS